MNALALIVLSAVAAHAGAAPKKGDCKLAGEERMQSGNVKPERAQAIAEQLVAFSSLDSDASLKRDGRAKTQVKYTSQHRFIEGSPALAAAAGFEPNKTKSHIILFTMGLLEFAQNEAEVAFILSHEVAHLAGQPNHAERKQEHAMALAEKYLSEHPEVLELSTDQAAGRIKAAIKDKIAAFSRKLEDEADIDGLNLMGHLIDPSTQRSYDRAAASDAMLHAKAWLDCLGEGGSDLPDINHDPIEKRVALLQERAAQMGAAGRRVNMSGAAAKANFGQ